MALMLSPLTKCRRRISAMMSIDNTPDSPAKRPDGCTHRGGNYWTLFTPGIWKVFHAVSHTDGAGAVLEAEWRATVLAHAQFNECEGGVLFGYWLLRFRRSGVKTECAAHLDFSEFSVSQARSLERLRVTPL